MVVPSLASWHEHHAIALDAIRQVRVIPAQVLLETVSVLSRLPGGLAQPLSVITSILAESFPDDPLTLPGNGYRALLESLTHVGARGGTVYDGVVGATAHHHGATLLSLDRRAGQTYRSLDLAVHWL